MAVKYEGKRLREIKPYKRKSPTGRTVYVESYYQRYDKPRGKINTLRADKLTTKSKTVWLKDNLGRFVGRANSKGKTTARKIAVAGADATTNYREQGRYGRIYGRTRTRR
jgi:hypothetical protein